MNRPVVVPRPFAVLLIVAGGAIASFPASPASAAATDGGTLHVCIDARGVRAYQDTPCAAATRTLGTRDFTRIAIDPALSARTQAIQTEMDRRNHGGGAKTTVVRGATRRAAAPSACEAAKARRKATLDRVGLKRTFDLLSRLDGEVWDACKGF